MTRPTRHQLATFFRGPGGDNGRPSAACGAIEPGGLRPALGGAYTPDNCPLCRRPRATTTMTRPASTSLVSRVSDLLPEPIRWLWPGRLALGKLALLEGDPGLGKSLVSLDLCARLSRGLPFPDGAAPAGPANALVLNAEDGAADTVRPRLASLGADLDRVFVPATGEGPLLLPGQAARLDAALAATGARLAVLDPLLAFLDARVAGGNDQSVRRALAPLAEVAARRDCAVLLIRHLTKKGPRRAVHGGAGAVGLVGLCRSAWLVGRDPCLPGLCVLAQVKNNLAPPQPSLAYRVASDEGGVFVSWLGGSPWSADQVMAGPPRPPARPRAADVLLPRNWWSGER